MVMTPNGQQPHKVKCKSCKWTEIRYGWKTPRPWPFKKEKCPECGGEVVKTDDVITC